MHRGHGRGGAHDGLELHLPELSVALHAVDEELLPQRLVNRRALAPWGGLVQLQGHNPTSL
eukprot:1218097-Pyramimonas_sp.AAC.2